MKGKANLVASLYRVPHEDRVYSVDQLALKAISRVRPLTLADEEECFGARREIFNYLAKKLDICASSGVIAPLSVVDRANYLFQWNKPSSLKARIQFSRIPTILETLDSLDDRQYEFACEVACCALGAKLTHVTTGVGDKSIDFVAMIPAYSRSPLFCSGKDGLRILGQAKLYKTHNVEEGEMKEFVQSIQDIRHRNHAACQQIPAWFLDSRAPMAGWMVGHSGVQDGAGTYAKNHGVVLADGFELASIIAAHPGLAYERDPSAIISWFKSELVERKAK